MRSFLKRIVPLRGNETKPFSLCCGIGFVLGLTFAMGGAVIHALFLKEFGTKYLSLMVAVNAVAVVLAFSVYDRFSGRFSSTGVFYGLHGILGVALVIIIAILFFKSPLFIYPVAFSFVALYSALLSIHFYAYLIDFFDIQQSKRLLPVILSANILGAMFGGLLVPFIIELTGGTGSLFLLWIVFLGLSSCLIFFNRRHVTLKKAHYLEDEEKTEGLWGSFKNNIGIVKDSPFIRLTLAAGLVAEILISGADIVSQTIFATSPYFLDTTSLAAFYGKVGAVIAAIGLIIQIFIVPPLIRLWGIGALNLVLPVMFFLSFSGLAFLPFWAFAFAIFTRFNYSAVAEYIEPTANNLLLNSLSSRQKTHVLSFSTGFVEPVGTILTGLMLAALTAFFALQNLILR